MYNHHQTGPAGTVMFAPPFRDPFNYNFDPLVPIGIDLVGAAMATPVRRRGQAGRDEPQGVELFDVVERRPADHGVLPQHDRPADRDDRQPDADRSIPFLPAKQLPDSSLYYPIEPQQTWHFRQSIDYSVTANYAVFDVASRNRDTFLYNIYQMGKNSIERGNRDSWTATPRRIIAAQAALAPPGRPAEAGAAPAADAPGGDEAPAAGAAAAAAARPSNSSGRCCAIRTCAIRAGFILPADQPDFPTATKFVNALLKTGVTVHRATAAFAVAGKSYPAGSYVVKSAQAFRPHVLDMFEPQDHPDDIPYPGRPADPAVRQRRLDARVPDGRQVRSRARRLRRSLREGERAAEAGAREGQRRGSGAGFLMSHAPNDAFTADQPPAGRGARTCRG